jgi:probable rRNA maturation factor
MSSTRDRSPSEKSASGKPQFSLCVQYATKNSDVPRRPNIRKWVQEALLVPADITLRIVDEIEGRALNREFRHKDYATNVLTFFYDDKPRLKGDIVICAAVVLREANEQEFSVEAHYAHLVVHGVLHLQGYDHNTDDEAETMENMESHIVMKLGYPNPYLDRCCN